MPTKEQLRDRLLKKLKELFQLDQPDLDFGFYRIMHVKAKDVAAFIDSDLLKIVTDAFGAGDEARKVELQANYEKAVQTAKDFGAPNPEDTEPVKKAQAALDTLKDTASAEADVYDHLYRFFERYYDDGDFISRRYFARETAGKAAPFAVPYNGEEVKLHWANADQYYIKTAEYFANYSFDLTQAAEIRAMKVEERILNQIPDLPAKVHFRIIDASEGEHGNVKAAEGQKRFFIIHAAKPLEVSAGGELVINFEYRADAEKGGTQEGTWRDKRNGEAVATVLSQLAEVVKTDRTLEAYQRLLQIAAPTDKDKTRPLLAKYINQYTARNSCDYFIHKDLGAFLRRELDFYIKNEVMRLDDIENADAPAVESYLSKIKVLRKIAGKLIDFLAQLENFQKKLWLKKKFVVETNYCITLDRVPEELYGEIAANHKQFEEWEKLGFITTKNTKDTKKDHQEPDLFALPDLLSCVSCVSWLKENQCLVLDTCFFDESFKERLIGSIENFDEQCDGLLIHSENFQALGLLQERYREQVKCVYIDPPYNTDNDDFLYKDSYRRSSWLTLMHSRLLVAKDLMSINGVLFISIDDKEYERIKELCAQIFGRENILNVISIKTSDPSGHKTVNPSPYSCVEYVLMICKDRTRYKYETYYTPSEYDSGYNQYIENVNEHFAKWSVQPLRYIVSQKLGYADSKEATQKLSKQGFNASVAEFALLYCESVFQPTAISKDAGKDIVNLRDKSKKHKDVVFSYERENDTIFIRNGRQIYFYSNKIKQTLESEKLGPAKPLTNLWTDIPWNGIANEGGVALKNGKKPEKLLFRIISMLRLNKGDVVLDFFNGSGTTAAVAAKTGLKWIGIESNSEIVAIAHKRLKHVAYGDLTGVSDLAKSRHSFFKYNSFESYEDTLNNLRFDETMSSQMNTGLREDFMLRYLLDVETRGSQSLLNLDAFADPTAYTLLVKKPGSDETVTKNVDLVETFNYLLGLRVTHLAAPQTFCATFKRNPDPELPGDQHTKLVVDGGIKHVKNQPHPHPNLPLEGEGTKPSRWWFRKIEGWLPKERANPNNGQQEKTLIVWRNLTGDLEQDNLMLDEWFQKNRISTRDFEFDTIYVNGSNNLPNLKKDEESWKVRLIEEEFHKRMWESGE